MALETNAAKRRRKANGALPDLPDDILHQIHRLLPTKPAVRMRCVSKQFGGVWLINLDEGDPIDSDDNIPRHTEFITNSINYLDSRNKDKHVDKFWLRMTRYSPDDDVIISRFLNFAMERNVMELDISLRHKPGTELYTFCPVFGQQNFITTLHLENLRISEGENSLTNQLPQLRTVSLKNVILDSINSLLILLEACPSIHALNLESTNVERMRDLLRFKGSNFSVKTMSLKNVRMISHSTIYCLISRCTSLEYLSLASFSLSDSNYLQVSNYSLKNFEYTDDHGASSIKYLYLLHENWNLIHVCIRAKHLEFIKLRSYTDALQATIDTPELPYFRFTGPLESKISVKAQIRCTEVELKFFPNITALRRHFPKFIDFLQTFERSEKIILRVNDAVDFVFSKRFRKIFSASRLHSLRILQVVCHNLPKGRESDLRDSMLWMAPNANIQISDSQDHISAWPY